MTVNKQQQIREIKREKNNWRQYFCEKDFIRSNAKKAIFIDHTCPAMQNFVRKRTKYAEHTGERAFGCDSGAYALDYAHFIVYKWFFIHVNGLFPPVSGVRWLAARAAKRPQ